MAEATHAEVHRHPAPTGFIRKYIFSVDHKVIGIQYIMLALTAVVVGMVMSVRSEEHTSELQSQSNLVCRLLLEKKKNHHEPHLDYFVIPLALYCAHCRMVSDQL